MRRFGALFYDALIVIAIEMLAAGDATAEPATELMNHI